LTDRFRTLAELLSAEPAIVAVDAGLHVANALAAARALMIHAAGDELGERIAIRTQEDAADFLKTLIGFHSDECLVVLFLNARRALIDYEMIAVGGPHSVELDQRRILFRAMSRGATGIILAHNHPSGDAMPSDTDVHITRQLADTARSLGICLHDHLVVAGDELRSAMFPD
jgi:DNA repair protein RadC